jgi:hypothetical protein
VHEHAVHAERSRTARGETIIIASSRRRSENRTARPTGCPGPSSANSERDHAVLTDSANEKDDLRKNVHSLFGRREGPEGQTDEARSQPLHGFERAV